MLKNKCVYRYSVSDGLSGKLYIFVWMLIIIMLGLSGCSNKTRSKESFTLDLVKIKDSNISAFTVDQNNQIYTTGLELTSDNIQYIKQYDSTGFLQKEIQLPNISTIEALVVKGDVCYFLSGDRYEGKDCLSLFSYHMIEGKLETIYQFSYLESSKDMVAIENKIYIIGGNSNIRNVVINQGEPYPTSGERLVCIDLESNDVSQIEVSVPISISSTKDNHLYIYFYEETMGYNIMKYNPTDDSGTIIATMDELNFIPFALAENEDYIIYSDYKSHRGLIMSKIDSIDTQARLYMDSLPWTTHLYEKDSKVYFMDGDRNLIALSIENMELDNNAINYLQSGFSMAEPYGCGYLMNKIQLDYEKLTLKILAQDPDYDLALLNSMDENSFNLKKNGSFYPLSEVSRINEYLDSCFSYVKEEATKEDGSIWMLPISVGVPTYILNKDVMKDINEWSRYDYSSFYKLLSEVPKESKYKHRWNETAIESWFFYQYFNKFTEVGTSIFEQSLPLLRDYRNLNAYWNKSNTYYMDPEVEILDFRFEEQDFMEQVKNENWNSKMKAVGVPKLSKEDKNPAYIIYLVINPNSKNLEETLNYLEDLITYTLDFRQTPFYFKKQSYEKNTLSESLYGLYEQGEIIYGIDEELYLEEWERMIQGNISYEDYVTETNRKLKIYFKE